MRFLKNFLVGVGGVVLLTGAGALLAPKSAHGIAVALVQVANTSGFPAFTQDVSKLSAQNAVFWCPYSLSGCYVYPNISQAYTVPAGKTFMITSVDFVWQGATAPASNFYTLYCAPIASPTVISEWYLAGGSAQTQFVYPSGIAVPAGCAANTSLTHSSFYDMIVRGYFSYN